MVSPLPFCGIIISSKHPLSNLAGVIACLTDECLTPSFRRHPTFKQQLIQESIASNIVKHLVIVTRAEPEVHLLAVVGP